ncbi:hypothetical protein IC1_05974 [Bacillus cereus VD022]|uniref:Uncharacterized protein n=1 Tax=Bacillus cereus TIAC219 TaxID=718222 RepID=A0ABC9SPT8_BACCE|nr:hypothetical protein IC1_05974 [Bacillus cereus VD022]EOQ57443.1 hypothetical protein IAY_06444 [Bacillus cereus TIAC219]
MPFGIEVGESVGAIPHGMKRLVTMNKKQKLKAKGKRFGLYNVEVKPIEITLTFGYVGLAMPFHEPKKVGQGLFFTAGTK